MPCIRQLPASVVNKIAAGEVIERAASVVKELMENAIDAGATRIDVSVSGGGSELVRVADNGCGISPEQLPLAVASHATSKIENADDLFRVGTLGFRGEALASIAEVSRFTLRSRARDEEAGAEMEVVAGQRGEVVPCGCPVGTTVEVRQLFFNTPVRRKFLKTAQTEMGHVTEAFTRLALAHPRLHFTLRHEQRTLHDLPPADNWLHRIEAFFGADLTRHFIPVVSQDGDVRLSGYVAHPSQSRSHPRMQYLFLNGRHIRDRALGHALQEAYRGLLLTGRYPISCLWFEMPADLVDVNVHPTKLEVRFQDGGRLYSQLLGALRSKFLATDLNTKLEPVSGDQAGPPHDESRAAAMREELVSWAKGQLAEAKPAAGQSSFTLTTERPPRAPLELNRLDRVWGESCPQPSSPKTPQQNASPAGLTAAANFSSFPASSAALQVHNRYLIAESEEGVVVIDQHALHERILYERLREKVLAGGCETQQLLVPEPVDLSADEAAAVLAERELLAQLGVLVEDFGGGTVLVRGYPAMLANIRPAELLRSLVEQLVSGGKAPDRRDVLDELLHMISCKAAIKAGDRLTPEEIQSLLEQRHLVHDAHHCPHGRPTALVFTREELDRQFRRT